MKKFSMSKKNSYSKLNTSRLNNIEENKASNNVIKNTFGISTLKLFKNINMLKVDNFKKLDEKKDKSNTATITSRTNIKSQRSN